MKRQMYAVRDIKAGAFVYPFFVQNHEIAIRSFGDMVRNVQSEFHKHPEDYSLYHLGDYDDLDGSVKSTKGFLLCQAYDFLSADQRVVLDNQKPGVLS